MDTEPRKEKRKEKNLQGFSCYTMFIKKVREPLVLLIKVQKHLLYLSRKVPKQRGGALGHMNELQTQDAATQHTPDLRRHTNG